MEEQLTKNPLIYKSFNIPFEKIKPEHFVPAVDLLLKKAHQQLEDLVNSQSERTFNNTVRVYEAITEELVHVYIIMSHLKNVDNNPETVKAFQIVEPKIVEFSSNLPRHEGLYEVLKEYAQTEEAAQLQGARKRFLTQVMTNFKRSGTELNATGKKRLSEIDLELADVSSKFSQNVLDSTNAYALIIEDESRLAGLPERVKDSAKERAEQKGEKGWLFTLHAPSFVPVLQYADDRELRKELYLAYFTRASTDGWDNRDFIAKMLILRQEKAELLGYDNFADLVLENRMAKHSHTAITFLEGIKSKIKERFQRENEELKRLYQKIEGLDAPAIEPWDINYYTEKLKQAEFNFNSEELRLYFSFGNVMTGLFGLVNSLYGISINETDQLSRWNGEGIKTYQVIDKNGTHLGSFFTDYFPREEKRDGAWMNVLYAGGPDPTGFKPHLAFNCGNLTPPLKEKPSLLSHQEVKTIFHEFGHLLHQILSEAEIRSHSGPSVAWDFVELPSQIMENWVDEKEFLNTFAKHYETGEPIPTELLEKMNKAKTFRTANNRMRQLSFGLLDFKLHTEYDPQKDGDVVEYSKRIAEEFSPAHLPSNYSMVTGFSHIFGNPVGYACGYYSYQWAEVLEADAFGRFRTEGIFNREVGRQFRHEILAKGDSEDPAQLYRNFMGRDPDMDAMLRRDGLL